MKRWMWVAVQSAITVVTLLSLVYALGRRSGYQLGRQDAWTNYMDMQSMVKDRVDKAIAAGLIP